MSEITPNEIKFTFDSFFNSNTASKKVELKPVILRLAKHFCKSQSEFKMIDDIDQTLNSYIEKENQQDFKKIKMFEETFMSLSNH